MTEFVVDEDRYTNRVPRELESVGVLTEPLTIAEKGLSEYLTIQQRLPWIGSLESPGTVGQRALVLGAGPVGLLGAMALVVDGFETFVASLEPADSPRGEFVKSIGGTYISFSGSSPEGVAKRIGAIDLMFEATGAAPVAFEMMKYLGTNAVFIFTGIPGRRSPIQVEGGTIMKNIVLNNQVVFGTVNAGRDAFELAIRDLGEFVRRWPGEVRSLITGRYPIDQAVEVIRGKTPGIKKVITFR